MMPNLAFAWGKANSSSSFGEQANSLKETSKMMLPFLCGNKEWAEQAQSKLENTEASSRFIEL
jgi:hypothetical protein